MQKIKPKKSLSQNFLIDKNIANKIINQTKIENKIIFEIGPGLGFLTDIILSKKPKKIILIEKDNLLARKLKEKYSDNKRVEIINKDILRYNITEFKNIIVISNLPYNISTKIILKLFNFRRHIKEMIFMVQKEVSLKFDYNLPKMNKYKFITYLNAEYSRCFDISANVFYPKPKVKSSIVKFVIKNNKINFDKANKFSNIIFKNIRKKISNNINIDVNKNILNKRVDKITLKELLILYNFF